MPTPNINLADIQLPAEDANKPVDIDPNEIDEGYTLKEGGQLTDQELLATLNDDNYTAPKEEEKKVDEKTVETTPPAKEEPPTVDAPAVADQAAVSADGSAVDPTKEPDAAVDDKLTPFHQHPDWIKSQDEINKLKERNAYLEGFKEAKTPEEKQEERKSAAQLAEQKLREKVQSGWQPTDRAEEIRVYNEFFEEELTKKNAAEQKLAAENQTKLEEKRNEVSTQISTIIADTYKETNVITDTDKETVAALAQEWRNKGLYTITPTNVGEVLKIAATQLRAEGKIGKVDVKPTIAPKTDEELAAEKVAKEEKDRANRLIGNPSSQGANPGASRIPIKNERRMDLDTLVTTLGNNLDKIPG